MILLAHFTININRVNSGTTQQKRQYQDNNQGTDPSDEKLLKITREIYPQISEDELKELVNMIPSHVKAMLKNMLPIMIKQVIKTMGQDKIQEMVEKARVNNP